MMGRNSLSKYYQTNFALMHHHKWALDHIDGLIPWEKDLYVDLLAQHIKEEEMRMQQMQNDRMAAQRLQRRS